MNEFDFVTRFVKQNNIKQIVVGSEMWDKLINYVSTFYPDLDSEYYGNIMFNDLSDLNVNVINLDD
mgnify:FL=1